MPPQSIDHDEVLVDILNQEKTVESVRNSAQQLLSNFREKLNLLRGNNMITEKLLRQGFDGQKCFDEAIKFFGTDEVEYIAVDGTEFEDNRLDLVIFFAGAFAYNGVIRFKEDGEVSSESPLAEKGSFGLSSAIPVSEDSSVHLTGELTEGGMETEFKRIPQALMHFSEYYLAYRQIKRNNKIRIVLMDRSVSGDIAHISWKMRELIAQDKNCLKGIHTSKGEVRKTDLELGRMLVDNKSLGIPSPRSQFLKFAAMKLLIENRIARNPPLRINQIIEKLHAQKERGTRLFRDLTTDFREMLASTPESEDSPIEISDSATTYWERLTEALETAAQHVFNPPPEEHPLKLRIGNLEKWISADDLDYLTLLTVYAILKEAWERNILVLGIVKDSAANELVKTVLPLLEQAGIDSFSAGTPSFDSDKMLLQANSVVNSSHLKPPWRTFEYDVCFRTISPLDKSKQENFGRGVCRVEGAFKNVITCERMFVKSYFQLWGSQSDGSVRSHVFLYDRPCYPQYDMPNGVPELVLKHKDVAEEEIIPTLHYISNSPISDLVMGILNSMGREPIPEALGHNYPLFLADKKAKWIGNEAAKASCAAVELEIARSKLDQQVLFESKFRNYRAEIESKRKLKK